MVSLKTSNEDFYRHIFMPSVKLIPAEESHKLAVLGFKWKLFGQGKPVEPDNLVRSVHFVVSPLFIKFSFPETLPSRT